MSISEETLDLLRDFVPRYLTEVDQRALAQDIRESFPEAADPNKVYIRLGEDKFYFQGDGIVDIPFSDFVIESGSFEVVYLKGVLLSNTCDVSPSNAENRLSEPLMNFAPIIPLDEYVRELKDSNISDSQITSFKGNLKSNRITNLFYLPELSIDDEIIQQESFVRLDYVVSLPLSLFNSDRYEKSYQPIGDRIFSFSNYGFYLFIVKLTIHLARIREGVFRSA